MNRPEWIPGGHAALDLRMLVVGPPGGRTVPVAPGAADDSIQFAEFDAIDAALLRRVAPDLVLSPLMSEHFDAMDLARVLSDLGFTGRYLAVTVPLPNPRLVRREIRGVAPGLDVDLLVIGEKPA